MSTPLYDEHCSRPEAGSGLDAAAVAELRAAVPEWRLVEIDGSQRLERVFEVKDFAAALALANQIGELAEAEDHHPTLLIEWGRLTVMWWTHAVGGLHRNDFICAAKTDELYQALLSRPHDA